MHEFAEATGLSGRAAPERYLWTDAFAVCNFLGLYRQTGEAVHLELALRLVQQVHRVLGRHRDDDRRRGWISGLDESEGERHPTRGGLRIGKRLPERGPGEPFEARTEWDRDGQYFHYLAQWMHALHRVAQETADHRFDAWGAELARAAHAGFLRALAPGESPRLAWKMSIDLRRVLVSSTGQHDALDALTAYLELREGGAGLEREIADSRRLVASGGFETTDSLGIGALLCDACRIARFARGGELADRALLARLVAAARASLEASDQADVLFEPAETRLPFREIGLAIGLHALERCAADFAWDSISGEDLSIVLAQVPLAHRIDEFWSETTRRQAASWSAHRDINSVMLATSLEPGGYLGV